LNKLDKDASTDEVSVVGKDFLNRWIEENI
jgi:hypothetical protein